MSASREQVMTALLAVLTGALQVSFTADADGTTGVLTNVSSPADLFEGLPVFGPSVSKTPVVPSGAVINAIGSNTVTLSQPTAAAGTGLTFKSGFQNTNNRRLQYWQDINAFPALFLRNIGDKIVRREKLPPLRTMHVEAWIYVDAGTNPDLAPGIALNNFIDAIEAALAPDLVIENRLTLGGLVYHCWIEGESLFSPGDGENDKASVAMIPIHILLP